MPIAADNDHFDLPLDQGILSELISRQARLTYFAILRLVERELDAIGITPQQFALLVLVERNPGARQTQLAQARGLDKSTLVPMIDRLEREGLLERRQTANDRRSKSIWITQAGSELMKKAVPAVRRSNQEVGSNLTENEREELIRLMEKLREGIQVE